MSDEDLPTYERKNREASHADAADWDAEFGDHAGDDAAHTQRIDRGDEVLGADEGRLHRASRPAVHRDRSERADEVSEPHGSRHEAAPHGTDRAESRAVESRAADTVPHETRRDEQPTARHTRVDEAATTRENAEMPGQLGGPRVVEHEPEPQRRSNRGVAILLVVLATVIFAVVHVLVQAIVAVAGTSHDPIDQASGHLLAARIYIPIIVFFLAFFLIALLLNRAGAWFYVVVSLIIGVLVYAATIVGAFIDQGIVNTNFGAPEVQESLGNWRIEFTAVIAGLVAREVSLWLGGLIGMRGTRLRTKFREEMAAFRERQAS